MNQSGQTMTAKVTNIWISPSTGEPIHAVNQVEAVEGKGLVGDRYYLGKGYYTGDKVWDANVTLISQEAHDAASAGAEEAFTTDCLRRNIVTQGIDLHALVGADFQIGSAVLRGTKIWPPCDYINSQNPGRDVLKKFAKSAGIGATVVKSGHFGVGDEIALLGDS